MRKTFYFITTLLLTNSFCVGQVNYTTRDTRPFPLEGHATNGIQVSIGAGMNVPSNSTKKNMNALNVQEVLAGIYMPLKNNKHIPFRKVNVGVNLSFQYGTTFGKYKTSGYTHYNIVGQTGLPLVSALGAESRKNSVYSIEAGPQLNIRLGKIVVSPILNAGYIRINQEAIEVSQTATINLSSGASHDTTVNYKIYTQSAIAKSGLAITPKVRLNYFSNRIGFWIEGNYTFGPSITPQSTAFKPQQTGAVTSNYSLYQMQHGVNVAVEGSRFNYSIMGATAGLTWVIKRNKGNTLIKQLPIKELNPYKAKVVMATLVNGQLLLAKDKDTMKQVIQQIFNEDKQKIVVKEVKVFKSTIDYFLAIVTNDDLNKITTYFTKLVTEDKIQYRLVGGNPHIVKCINQTGCPYDCGIFQYGPQGYGTGCNCGADSTIASLPAMGNTTQVNCNFNISYITERKFAMAMDRSFLEFAQLTEEQGDDTENIEHWLDKKWNGTIVNLFELPQVIRSIPITKGKNAFVKAINAKTKQRANVLTNATETYIKVVTNQRGKYISQILLVEDKGPLCHIMGVAITCEGNCSQGCEQLTAGGWKCVTCNGTDILGNIGQCAKVIRGDYGHEAFDFDLQDRTTFSITENEAISELPYRINEQKLIQNIIPSDFKAVSAELVIGKEKSYLVILTTNKKHGLILLSKIENGITGKEWISYYHDALPTSHPNPAILVRKNHSNEKTAIGNYYVGHVTLIN